MSDIPLWPSEFNLKLGIESSSLAYAAKAVARYILFAVKIPYPLIRAWHKYFAERKEIDDCSIFTGPSDYVDFLEMAIPWHTFCISNDKEVRTDIK